MRDAPLLKVKLSSIDTSVLAEISRPPYKRVVEVDSPEGLLAAVRSTLSFDSTAESVDLSYLELALCLLWPLAKRLGKVDVEIEPRKCSDDALLV